MKFAVLALPALLLLSPDAEKLTWSNYEKLRALIDVTPAALAWQKTEWRTGFWNGLVEAQAKDKPIFYWIYDLNSDSWVNRSQWWRPRRYASNASGMILRLCERRPASCGVRWACTSSAIARATSPCIASTSLSSRS